MTHVCAACESEMSAIVVWGAGGHAKVVAQSLRRNGSWRLVGFIDDVRPQRLGEPFEGAVVLGGREVLPGLLAQGTRHLMLAFGDNVARLQLWRELVALGFEFPSVVDAHAVVADDAVLGPGCYVGVGAVIQPGARLGAQVIVNTGAVIEHDCRVGDGAHLCPRTCIAGHVEVGGCAWIGVGAVVRDHCRVGAHSLVGMGSVVVKDVPERVVAYGHPCHLIRKV